MRWSVALLSLLGSVAGGVLLGFSLLIPAYISGYMDGLGHESQTEATK